MCLSRRVLHAAEVASQQQGVQLTERLQRVRAFLDSGLNRTGVIEHASRELDRFEAWVSRGSEAHWLEAVAMHVAVDDSFGTTYEEMVSDFRRLGRTSFSPSELMLKRKRTYESKVALTTYYLTPLLPYCLTAYESKVAHLTRIQA